MTAKDVQNDLNEHENPADAAFLQRFFKTGPGEYGEGDVLIGLRVPKVREIAKKYRDLSVGELEKLLDSPIHEHRLCAVIIMAEQMKRALRRDPELARDLYELYVRRTDRLNNWDIVDVSCRDVVGGYLQDRSREPLYELARSKVLWERRIAMVSTWQFIRVGDLDDTFKIAELLLDDQEDLMHKAVGWMLREAGKKDEARLKAFLDSYAAVMPRTMLRYSLERLHPEDKAHFMGLRAAS